jgi:hypothetical protein
VPQDPQKSETKADKVADVLDKIAAPDWRLAHHMWSVQLSVLWAIIGGLWVSLPAFQTWLHPVPFACVCVGFSLAILFARLTNQPGLPLI